jgi:hypothetical protein
MSTISKRSTENVKNGVDDSTIEEKPAKKLKVALNVGGKFTKEQVACADFCSCPEDALTEEQLQDCASASKLLEKDLIGKGRLFLQVVDNNLIFTYAGKKFVGKDLKRVMPLFDAAKDTSDYGKSYVLLANGADICKGNSLPGLCTAGVIVQRVP